jgi:hypothetical protein
MTDQQIKQQIDIINTVTARLLAAGPKACRQFLIDAGIIKPKRKRKCQQ